MGKRGWGRRVWGRHRCQVKGGTGDGMTKRGHHKQSTTHKL